MSITGVEMSNDPDKQPRSSSGSWEPAGLPDTKESLFVFESTAPARAGEAPAARLGGRVVSDGKTDSGRHGTGRTPALGERDGEEA